MTKLLWTNRVLLTLLSIMTAVVKLARMEEEMVIFRNVGLSDGMIVAFGVVQLVGGLLLLAPKTTKLGAWLMLPTFVFATGVLFANHMVPFGVSSLLFIAMAALHGTRWGYAKSELAGEARCARAHTGTLHAPTSSSPAGAAPGR